MKQHRNTKWIARGALLGLLGSVGIAQAQNQAAQPANDALNEGDQGVVGNMGMAGPGENPNPKPGPSPLSSQHRLKIPAAPIIALEAGDNLAFSLTEDARGIPSGVKCLAIPRSVTVTMDHGAIFETDDGGHVWVVDIQSPNATALRVSVKDFNLPDGAAMVVYAPSDPQHGSWQYTGRGDRGLGEFFTWTTEGDTQRIEVYFPESTLPAAGVSPFRIDSLMHHYRDLRTGYVGPAPEELNCHRDVRCVTNWANQSSSVVGYGFTTNAGVLFCSGQQLNNNAGDLTPYMYTAEHCFNSQSTATNLEVYWFWTSATCNGNNPPSPLSVPRSSGATLLRTSDPADGTFVLIEGTVPRANWWNGWLNADPGSGERMVSISHPDGTYKRITDTNQAFATATCGATGLTQGFITRHFAGGGALEPGSSGSPVMALNGVTRGTLSCGSTPFRCANGTSNDPYAWFGSLAAFFPQVGTFLQNAGSDDGIAETCGSASSLTFFGTANYGTQTVRINHDNWYTITVPNGGDVRVTLTFTHAWGDVDMALTNGCGGGGLGSSAGTGNTETVFWANNTGAAVAVKIRAYLFNDTRNYFNLTTILNDAPVPTNNACTSALIIDPNDAHINSSTAFATIDGGTNCPGFGTTAPDVYYRFTPRCAGGPPININTIGSTFDTVLSVHTGCPATSANTVACNDDFFGVQSNLDFVPVANQTYYIRMSGYNGGNGPFTLNLHKDPSVNDHCADAVALVPGTYDFTTCGHDTDGPAELLCNNASDSQVHADFWNIVNFPDAGTLEVNTFGSPFDTKVALYATSCPVTTDEAIACNDDANFTLQSQVIIATNAGQDYYIRTGGYNGATGDGVLTVIFTPGMTGCDSIDFNNDGVSPDSLDIEDYISVFGGGPCSNDPNCNDIDFNNDGVSPDSLDIDQLLEVFGGGSC